MEKERYKVRVSDDLCFVGVFDLQENKYVVNESVICLDTAHLLCDLFNKVDKQVSRIKELEKENQKANIKNYLTDYYLVEKENQQLKEQLEETKQTGSYQVILMCQKDNILLKQQLKQSQNKKAIEVLEKVKKYFLTTDDWLVDGCELLDFVNNLIKELEGEKDWKKVKLKGNLNCKKWIICKICVWPENMKFQLLKIRNKK